MSMHIHTSVHATRATHIFIYIHPHDLYMHAYIHSYIYPPLHYVLNMRMYIPVLYIIMCCKYHGRGMRRGCGGSIPYPGNTVPQVR